MRRMPTTMPVKTPLTPGFTMIEMVMVIVILGILAGLTAPIFSQGLTAARLTTENLNTLTKLRYTTERLAREIRQINYTGATYDITTMSATTLAFTKADPTSTGVTVSASGNNLTLAYSAPAISAILTDEVNGFGLIYYDASGAVTASAANVAFVEISLTLQNPTTGGSYSQRTRVALRDKS